ncbi:MAG: indole-3-glycerol phosphate synthase TrpC [Candidatus Rokubacteria bacterium]|nr:indole-3-glycerol phosphate synthase TrpC [Candidatus Rokubacteria bacterium]
MGILEEIVQEKRRELAGRKAELPLWELQRRCNSFVAPRDFEGALRPRPGRRVALIAELKKASPSRGILAEHFDPVALARTCAASGAAAFSVLTDEKFFQGRLDTLGEVRGVVDLPLLRKDFILDEYQLWESRAFGADAVLLIGAALDPSRLGDLLHAAKGLGLATLVEVHTREELDLALSLGAPVIGINNRNLQTFETRLETSLALLPPIPPGPVVVSESGFFTRADVERVVAAGAHAVLVGEALVRAPDIAAKIRELALLETEG